MRRTKSLALYLFHVAIGASVFIAWIALWPWITDSFFLQLAGFIGTPCLAVLAITLFLDIRERKDTP